jgi:hypothetical protein
VLLFYKIFCYKEQFKSKDKYIFLPDEGLEFDDNFGNIINISSQSNHIQKYIEGFTNDVSKEKIREKFTQENRQKLLAKLTTPRYVWTYWENKSNRIEPYAHIQLCFDTMYKHYGKYNFIILNPASIKQYLPNVRSDLDNLMIAQKVDYYRVALLEKYGGVWVDADTIVLKNLDKVFEKLDNGYDFVGFGCTGKKCFNGYPDPSNGVMGSRKNGRLMGHCLKKLDEMLDADNTNYKYFDLGKNVIWECKDELIDYDYYHFSSEYDGSRDKDGKWVHSPNHLSTTPTQLLDENKAFFIFLANYELMNDEENKWFLDLDKEQILNGKMWISTLYKKGLGLN